MTTSAPSVPAPVARPIRSRSRLNRWDSPWLNAKFLIGLSMVLSIALMGVIGQFFWDPTLAYPASSPLNLPPAWVRGPDIAEEESAATETAGSGASLTGGNPFKKEETAAASTTASTTRSRFGAPTWEHPLGTESNGRDMLAVLLVGAPRSLRIGLIAATIGMVIGIVLGFTAGYLGGWVDALIRTLSDAIVVIPALAVLIVIAAYVRTISVENMALLLALFAWPGPTRLIRAQVLSMRERGYVQMARISGAGPFSIMFGEMLPNLLPYLAASYTGNVSGAILPATSLEVLGLGPTRIPTLGMTIFYAIKAAAILRGMWWWWGVPIVALVIVFSGLFLMTIGLDEIANPRLRGRTA
ncbi:MAG TPA: ABC transporter permease [Caldilineaceae bacterium]|nr:ABC transporter permease [Caldilineaceae bacterium]